MPSPTWEDLSEFFDDFAVPVRVTQQSGGEMSFNGIFDAPYQNAELGRGGTWDVDTSKPTITCRETDVATVLRGDVVTVNGETFDVLSNPHTDGTGLAVLELAPPDGSY